MIHLIATVVTCAMLSGIFMRWFLKFQTISRTIFNFSSFDINPSKVCVSWEYPVSNLNCCSFITVSPRKLCMHIPNMRSFYLVQLLSFKSFSLDAPLNSSFQYNLVSKSLLEYGPWVLSLCLTCLMKLWLIDNSCQELHITALCSGEFFDFIFL